jgi:hypothetical protein
MKFRVIALMLLAGSSVFAGSRFYFGVGIAPPPVVVYAPPPPPVAAYMPPCPGPDYSWVAGYWYPAGPRYAWRAGYWARPPYARGYWEAPRYYERHYYPGYWRNGHGPDRNHDRGRGHGHGRWER